MMFEENNRCYENISLEFPNSNNVVLHRVNSLDIPLNPEWKNIGINLSGGADSACLLMLLCELIVKNNYDCKIHVLTYIRGWSNKPWQEPISVQVYEKIKSIYPNIIVDRHTCFIAPELEYSSAGKLIGNRSGDQIIGASYNGYMEHKLKLNSIYNATSARPKDDQFDNGVMDKDNYILSERYAPNPNLAGLINIKKNGFVHCTPFRFIDKSWIIAQYFLFNKLDILKVTRSCESDVHTHTHWPKLHNYTPDTVVPECGVCFWCLERNWALKMKDSTISEIEK